jgi:hypothetical protein
MSDEPATSWYGWAWHLDRWHRLTGPCGTIAEAAAGLGRVLAAEGWRVPERHQVLTGGPEPPRRPDLTHHSTQNEE